MARAPISRKPTFLWQALLIVLPVIVLAGVAIISIREDRLLAQREAAERAQEIADELLPRIWQQLKVTDDQSRSQAEASFVNVEPLLRLTVSDDPRWFQRHAFKVDAAGNLLFPPPVLPLPEPKPFNATELTASQLRHWQTAQANEGDNSSIAIQAYRDFLSFKPPENFAAAAEYGLGLLLSRTGNIRDAGDAFRTVSENYPNMLGESGLPLRPLAQLKLLELEVSNSNQTSLAAAVSLDSLCSNLVYQPSPLSWHLLQAVGERPVPGTDARDIADEIKPNTSRLWIETWKEHEDSRELFQSARHAGRTGVPDSLLTELYWFHHRDQEWLAMSLNGSSTSCWYVCRPEAAIVSKLRGILERKAWPDYLGVGVEVAGKLLAIPGADLRPWREVHYAGKGGGVAKRFLSDFGVPMIATNLPGPGLLASAMHAEGGNDLLKVNVYLTSPEALFTRQTARTFWFGSLIGVSALAAMAGLLTAWRAFYTQQRLSEMKSNFVSSVSHELRAPIASVRLLAESLEKGKIKEPEKQVEYFRFIGQECRRLSGLIQNVLDFSRIDQGRKQYEFESTDILALTRQTVSLMQTYAEEKQVALRLNLERVQPETTILEFSMDGRAIQQALVNLIDNAIKHSPKGETVVVGVECVSEETASSPPVEEREGAAALLSAQAMTARGIKVWVEDHGPGIPAEEHKKIFERFYRVGSELRRETQGVGIGLSIVKHVVEAHGGCVQVRSAPGEGSRFTIELPGEMANSRDAAK